MMMMILPTMMSILLYSRENTLNRLFLFFFFFLFFLNTILVYEEEGKISMVRIGGEGRRGWNDIIRRNFFREGGNSAG